MKEYRTSFSIIIALPLRLAMLGSCLIAPLALAQSDDEVAKSESPYLQNVRQITFASMGLVNAGEAYFSPDGKQIIFQATPEGKDEYQIYTMTLDGGKPKMVSTGKGACTCSWFHPSGKKILFASSHLDPTLGDEKPDTQDEGYKWNFDEYMDIFEANPDGSNLKRLTYTPGYDAEGSWSPDGSQIVFTSQRDGDLEIYVMNADGTNPRRITNGKGYDGGPFFSPDGKLIIYRGDRRDDGHMNLQIRLAATDGSFDKAITDNPIFNWCPYWYPDGKSFIFTQADHEAYSKGKRPNYDLYMMDLEGNKTTRITFDKNFDGLPVFSPDGKRLMWTSQRGVLDEAQIFIADFKLPDAFRN